MKKLDRDLERKIKEWKENRPWWIYHDPPEWVDDPVWIHFVGDLKAWILFDYWVRFFQPPTEPDLWFEFTITDAREKAHMGHSAFRRATEILRQRKIVAKRVIGFPNKTFWHILYFNIEQEFLEKGLKPSIPNLKIVPGGKP